VFPLRSLQSDKFLREIHHLLWIDPFLNGEALDYGWSCRDHAWASACLIRLAGHEPVILRGSAVFFRRASASEPLMVLSQKTHAWCAVDGLGSIDLSVQDTATYNGQTIELPARCIYANKWVPEGRGTVAVLSQPSDFTEAANYFARANRTAAVYEIKDGESLSPNFLIQADRWSHSPLTDRIRDRGCDPSAFYCSVIEHLLNVLRGGARSLADLDQPSAHSSLMSQSDGAQARVRESMRAVGCELL